MKTIMKRAIRGQKGQVLTLVLILLVLGGLILAPLLGLMTTGLMSGQVYENKMYEYYAADAGIEDALWRLVNEDWLPFYRLDQLRGDLVNGKEVAVAIESVWLLEGLEGLEGLSDLGLPSDQPQPGDDNYANDHWAVTGAINIENTANYIIDITTDEPDAENATVSHVGVWLPPGYGYVEGSTEINGVGIGGGNDLVADPVPPEGISYKDGTLLIWQFPQGTSFKNLSDISVASPGGCTPAQKFPPSVRLSFDYSYTGSAETPGGPGEYTVPDTYTFTVPAGVTSVTIEAWGGGGGGGGRRDHDSGGAGGGGGGAYAQGTVLVTAGQTYTVTVGAGGVGGTGGNNAGSAGGDSSFVGQSTVLAKGGAGGGGGVGGTGGGGGSADSSVGSVKYSGGNGASGRDSRSGGGGGGAGDANPGGGASRTTGGAGGLEGGGDGADGRSNDGVGYGGSPAGGAGSGAFRASGGPYSGGDGAHGKVIVRYEGATSEEPGGSAVAKGFFSWILLGDGHIAWDSQTGVFHIVSEAADDLDLGVQAGTTVETYTIRSLPRYSPGIGGAASAVQGDYIAIGNSLMTSCWKDSRTLGPPCNTCSWGCRGSKANESSATVNVDAVPDDATIQRAYLYWSAWRRENGADGSATLTVTSAGGNSATFPVTASKGIWIEDNAAADTYFYSSFADVTSKVKTITTEVGGTTFTVGGVDVDPATRCSSDGADQSAYAGWSVIIIYSSAKKDTHQIYLYDEFYDQYDQLRPWLWSSNGASAEFAITGFEAPQNITDVKLTVFAGEGDDWIYPTYVEFAGQDTSYAYLGDRGTYPSTDDPNPWNNVFNSRSGAAGFTAWNITGQDFGEISGVDIDTYTKDRYGVPLSQQMSPGDSSANIRVQLPTPNGSQGGGCDGIMLIYVILSVPSAKAPSGSGFDVGTMTYQIG